MPEIIIEIKDKRPQIIGTEKSIVADNSDYTIRFIFDELWEDSPKTVYFVRSNGYAFAPVQTVDNEVNVPVQSDVGIIANLYVGVQQGDVKTSRACEIKLLPAITDNITDNAVQPDESMWQNHEKRLVRLEKYGGGGSGLAYDIGFGLSVSEDYVLSAEVGATSFAEIPNTKVQEIFNKVMEV